MMITFKACALIMVLVGAGASHTVKAGDIQPDVVVSGAVSGWLLSKAFLTMQSRGLTPNMSALFTAGFAVLAHGIRASLFPIKNQQSHAAGLLAGFVTFFGCLANP